MSEKQQPYPFESCQNRYCALAQLCLILAGIGNQHTPEGGLTQQDIQDMGPRIAKQMEANNCIYWQEYVSRARDDQP